MLTENEQEVLYNIHKKLGINFSKDSSKRILTFSKKYGKFILLRKT